MKPGQHDHSIYDHCLDCGMWTINTPEYHKCGDCQSAHTIRYYPEECFDNSEEVDADKEREPQECGCTTEYTAVTFDSDGRSYGGEVASFCQKCGNTGWY